MAFGQLFPSETFEYTDPATGLKVRVLTSHPAGNSKPYQTHRTWTSDGEWILFRSNRVEDRPQAFLVHETRGEILQLTDGEGTDISSLMLNPDDDRLYFERHLPEEHHLIELDTRALINDALGDTVGGQDDYERLVTVLPTDLQGSGGSDLDMDGTAIYWGVRTAPAENRDDDLPALGREGIDSANTDPRQSRELARRRFEIMGRGPGGIRRIDVATGEVTTVIDVDFRMGHVQTNPWVAGEIIFCHETTGQAPQRMWTVRADGSGLRPLYDEHAEEWVTHETVSAPDEVMFNIMAHLPHLAERPSGVAVISLRTGAMRILGQGPDKGYWHCNGSPDGRWAVVDDFNGDITLLDRRTGEMTMITTGHVMKPDHTHPIFSPDSRRILIQTGRFSDGASLDLAVVEVPERLAKRAPAL